MTTFNKRMRTLNNNPALLEFHSISMENTFSTYMHYNNLQK